MPVENTKREGSDLITGNVVNSVLLMFFSVMKPFVSVRDLTTAVKLEGELIKYFIPLLMLKILLCQKRCLPGCVPRRLPK